MSRTTGTRWERVAESYLRKQGLVPVDRNFRCRMGEIDLVLRDGRALVFAEVRYRRGRGHGDGAESVTVHKQRRIVLAASRYLQIKGGNRSPPCRFDVVSIGHEAGALRIDWIADAFDAEVMPEGFGA